MVAFLLCAVMVTPWCDDKSRGKNREYGFFLVKKNINNDAW